MSLPEPHNEMVATTVYAVNPSVAKYRGNYRIAYGDENRLKFASRDRTGIWMVEVIDPEGGGLPWLVYDEIPGNAHIAYTVGKTLKYAKGTE
ncbi:hypothetical protein [Oceanobacillus piezotolerans]|uniref:hypothetical protein n=1 Tax=Oceanobacillus piezotolerans TaxID=2448030 RepID=UPI0011C37169|nr:hypothetical protein [Oceanobacillus piezotolerans]